MPVVPLASSHGFSVNWGTDWGTADGVTTVETVIQGKPVRLLDTWTIPGAVVDLWETTDQSPESVFKTGTVITVIDGQEIAAQPFFGWESVYGYAVVQHSADDVVERFLEALRQEHDRHEERHTIANFRQG